MLSAVLFRDSIRRSAIDDDELLARLPSSVDFNFFVGGGAIFDKGLDNRRVNTNLEINAVFTDEN